LGSQMALGQNPPQNMKIACVGDVGIDYYKNLGLLKPGGIAFNFAYNLRGLGIKSVSLISVLGNDRFSKKLFNLLKSIEINASHVQKLSGNSPKQNIFLGKGERKFTGYEAGVLKKWKLRKKDRDFIKKQDAIFVPLSDGMEHIFNDVKKINGPIKAVDFSQDYEFADFDKKESVITKNAKYFDVIFIGGEKKYEKAVQVLAKQYLRKVFILTLGKDGSIAYHEGIKILQPAYKIKKVVDTTGCGDAFQAAFLASWLENKNIKTALIKGAKRAADIIKTVGSTPFNFKMKNIIKIKE